ncbi:GATA TYPE ZINC FINGER TRANSCRIPTION FACTOR FAMILY PROTEIN [Salix purpurea]|uniref:GATA TYPE ZINC FINGER TRANSCRIPTION FACTOR FAMILY PROTEIN n=1 Tax=Salix purpurea TaxID=77065 RepID=A0A9Q0WAP2_SALPP|nr:GATA TYPE ZINC FINGER TRANSCRIPTION FACTOR FAMILY PROTEIN [Salix purpurea]
MDICRNVTLSAEYHQQEKVLASPPPCPKLAAAASTAATLPLDDLFSAQNTEVDFSLEWLSVFVEDCLSSTGNCLPPPTVEAQKPKHRRYPPENLETETPRSRRPISIEEASNPGKVKKQEEKAFW